MADPNSGNDGYTPISLVSLAARLACKVVGEGLRQRSQREAYTGSR